ncbi:MULTISPECIES: glycosyltransferase family 2 protein [unclassified Moorena]|uniref:glycosyltransferase family 2 protein n=1 Tax=unclassified Moorena TaxID=2683338 RepID=UPI0013B762F4|nr:MULTISPECIES: glycosyltransferase family 2 protein [unclassified Moorena]NER85559.1 glycosyltransferase family 2 protein [Moorena sp. SIO3A2]NES42822.1 glycosyltransferase family 2 protein [Moorena sp. SIO2C4]
MSKPLLASIVINNYNYGRFLRQCIDSALNQSFGNTEVVVVDDGSTDNSREIISSYGEYVTPVFQNNQGQASAFNSGFAQSRGDVIIFLDADDMLLPTAVENALPFFEDPEVVKVQWPLSIIDAQGRLQNRTKPDKVSSMPEGNLREAVIKQGPTNYVWPPTSGNAWSRTFLNKILPMDQDKLRLAADNYLFEAAPFFGLIKTIKSPQSYYRIHLKNYWQTMSFDEKLKFQLRFCNHYFPILSQFCKDMGISVDLSDWLANSWWYRLNRAVQKLDELIPAKEPFVLVDDAIWGMEVTSFRHPIPFLEKEGKYWGYPPNDEVAIQELERLREAGAKKIVFAWSAFWWLEHYAQFYDYLCSNLTCTYQSELIVVFDLKPRIKNQWLDERVNPALDRGISS